MAQQQVADHDDRPKSRSRSNTSTSQKDRARPKSRTSTTSLQSVDIGHSYKEQHRQQQYVPVQPHPSQQVPIQPHGHHPGMMQAYAQPPPHNMPHNMPHNVPQQIPPHMAQGHYHQQPPMDPTHPMSQHDMRPVSQQGFNDAAAYAGHYPAPMPQYQPHMQQHFRRDSMQYEGSPAPEDSSNENKRKKGTASTMANDQELRRLLQQHEGKTLRDIALEVQKTEGQNGGKAEKAKQVFAMIWLRESCVRSTNSVRRDRVFARYTECCGGERVPTLNPASFGKLVRIIFPNVQTRRLGVRGESKYHYVDLSLVANDDEDRMYSSLPASFPRPSTSGGMKTESGQDDERGMNGINNDGRPASRHDMETADFPAPHDESHPQVAHTPAPVREEPSITQPTRLCCVNANTGVVRIGVRGLTNALVSALPAGLPHLPGTISTYEAMPDPSLFLQQQSVQDAPVELPDIAPYLADVEHDPSIAQSLFHLYRSYCIDVIDSFRKCREKPFFQHHTAFNGKMTVPVSKLFNLECLAPWIQECDMRMYKQLARFLAPLVLQNVPSVVWAVFETIAHKLVPHIINAFEEKCPVHVVVAKTVPAARFSNLLKKIKAANSATLQMARLLLDTNARTQMWLDLMSMVDPDTVLEDGRPPVECLPNVQGVLKHDMRTLLDPAPGDLVTAAEDDMSSPYPIFLSEPSTALPGVLSLDALNQSMSLLDKWISWLQCLPQTFEGHHPACMLSWHGKFWRSILHQLGSNGAISFQSWWYAEDFTTSLLSWMAEMQGLLMSNADQKLADAREVEKTQQILSTSTSSSLGKRKREMDTFLAAPPPAKRVAGPPVDRKLLTPQHHKIRQDPKKVDIENVEPELPEMPQADPNDTDAEMDEINRAEPLKLPSYPGYTMSSPLKMSKTPMRAGVGGVADDSGIDLGLDLDAEALSHAKNFNKNDWFLSSDPVEPGVGVGSGVVV